MYFFKTILDGGRNRLRPLPGQKANGAPLKTNYNTKVPPDEKNKRERHPIGTVFAAEQVEDFGSYYAIRGNWNPVSLKDNELQPGDRPTPEMKQAWREYLATNRPVAEAADPAAAPTGKNTLMARLRKDHPVPTIEADGFSVNEQDWYYILRCITKKIPLLLTGPSGTGKTELLQLACRKMGLAVRIFDMGTTIDPISTLLGTHRIVGGESTFDYSDFAKAVQAPGVILLDELSRAPELAQNLLFPCLDSRRTLPVEQAGGDQARSIPVHPECTFVATANINGMGGDYSGTRPIDDALKDRFLPLETSYPDELQEKNLLMKRCGITAADAIIITKVANDIRQAYKLGTLSRPVSTRETIAVGEFIADGAPTEYALSAVILPLYSDAEAGDERDTARTIILSR